MSIRHRAVAIVIYNGELLVIKRSKNNTPYYVLPGGGVEADESLELAAKRELQEETSVTGEVVKPIYRTEIDNGARITYFLVKYISGSPRLGNFNEKANMTALNTYEPLWLPINELPKNLYPGKIRQIILENHRTGFLKSLIVDKITLDRADSADDKFM